MTATVRPGSRLGAYEILAPLGAGGMGSVWRARDARLGREVAVKVLSTDWRRDEAAVARFRREAHLLAAVTHPNVCQIFDLGEHDGLPYLAMELLSGEALDARLARGPLAPREAAAVALAVLSALAELHSRGIIHRDLKPSNVFLTPHGVKLLDLGLARRSAEGAAVPPISHAGGLYGTPRYMAPEQWSGEATSSSDLYACGALLYEMLSGRPALDGANAAELLRAATRGGPSSLGGGYGVEALSRVIRRAMAVRPQGRFASAAEMASAIAAARPDSAEVVRPGVGPLKRLLVLPLRLLRPDPEVEFLSIGLADALTASLSRRPDLVVHSSRVAAGLDDESPARLAAEAGVDAVLCGTLLRAGERVRVAAQLIEAPSGAVLASTTAEGTMADLFQLQDDLERQVASALRVSLDRGAADRPQIPPRPEAYEAYLRGVGVVINPASTLALRTARDHFRHAVDLDPALAPAWAQLGRVHRVLAKYEHGEPEEDRRLARQAFDTALALDPDLPLAHNLYTNFEIEDLANPVQALLRLLSRVERSPADPDLFAGLVVACRFTGLLEASLAAHRQARRLDPQVRTSVHYTHWMLGEYETASVLDHDPDRFLSSCALALLEGGDQALPKFEAWRARHLQSGLEVALGDVLISAVRRDRDACRLAAAPFLGSAFRDAEGLYFVARALARAGAVEEALDTLDRVVATGFTCPDTFARDPWLEPVRAEPRYTALAAGAAEGYRHASGVFTRADGPRLLGLDGDPTVTLAPRDDPPAPGGAGAETAGPKGP